MIWRKTSSLSLAGQKRVFFTSSSPAIERKKEAFSSLPIGYLKEGSLTREALREFYRKSRLLFFQSLCSPFICRKISKSSPWEAIGLWIGIGCGAVSPCKRSFQSSFFSARRSL